MIRLRSIRQFDRLPPARKLLALVIAMAGRDGATSLRFDHYAESRIDVWYFVGGVPYQLIPPPCSLWPYILRELRRNTTLDRPNHRRWRRWFGGPPTFPEVAAAGHLWLRLGGFRARAGVEWFRGRNGEHVEIVTTDPDLRAGSNWFYCEWSRHGRDGSFVEFPDPDPPK